MAALTAEVRRVFTPAGAPRVTAEWYSDGIRIPAGQ
jgi:hypothetical protein